MPAPATTKKSSSGINTTEEDFRFLGFSLFLAAAGRTLECIAGGNRISVGNIPAFAINFHSPDAGLAI